MAFEIEYEADCYCRKCRKGFATREGYLQHDRDKHSPPAAGAPIPEEYFTSGKEKPHG